VLAFEPDASSMQALGANPMDSTAAPAALEAGIRQGEAEAASHLSESYQGSIVVV